MRLLLVLWCLCLEIELSVATKLFTVYWNTTNPVFRIDNTDHIYDVNRGNIPFQYDQVNIICPQYPEGYTGDLERYIIYNVSKEEYESCRITNPNPRVIAVCDKPYKLMYFTITFRSFTPQPGGLEFRPGQDYFFISTSSPEDLHRRIGGSCKTHHMKVVFKVCCESQSILQTEEILPVEGGGTEYEIVSPQSVSSSSSEVGISQSSLPTVAVTSQMTTPTVPVKTTDRNFYKTIPSQDKSEVTKKTDNGWKHPNDAAVVSSGSSLATSLALIHISLWTILMTLSVPR